MERYRIVEGVSVYFLTFTVVDWLPVFVTEAPCKIVTDSLNFCIASKGLRVSSYVIMPTHLHLIALDADSDAERLRQTLTDLRKFTGRQLADYCTAQMPACFAATLRERGRQDRERRFWQATQHPVGLLTEQVWQQKMDYLHMNPCRKGLVHAPEDWRFSSASFWLKARKENDVDLAEAVW